MLELRERLAGMAMQGMLSNEFYITNIWRKAKNKSDSHEAIVERVQEYVAKRSVEFADALINELEKIENKEVSA